VYACTGQKAGHTVYGSIINQQTNQQTNEPTNQPLSYIFLNFTKYKPSHKMQTRNIIAFAEVDIVSFVCLYISNCANFAVVHSKLWKGE
jgi:hypothetical protein